jgi:AmiR/NasT family two-component response regulator
MKMVGDEHGDPRYSTTGSILARKLKIAVILPDDSDRRTLVDHLKRMGFQVQISWPAPKAPPEFADLIFLSCQPDKQNPYKGWNCVESTPLIAVLNYESPIFIDYALKLGSQAVLTTPIRASGLLSAIALCVQRFRDSRRQADRVRRLELKLKGVMQLAEAKTILMRMYSVSEADAYEILRTQAMAKRITIEEISQSIIQANDIFSSTTPTIAHKT